MLYKDIFKVGKVYYCKWGNIPEYYYILHIVEKDKYTFLVNTLNSNAKYYTKVTYMNLETKSASNNIIIELPNYNEKQYPELFI